MTKREARAIRTWRRLVTQADEALSSVPESYFEDIPDMARLRERLVALQDLAARYDAERQALLAEVGEIIGDRGAAYFGDRGTNLGWALRSWIERTALKRSR